MNTYKEVRGQIKDVFFIYKKIKINYQSPKITYLSTNKVDKDTDLIYK
jgi:hypothetical protein